MILKEKRLIYIITIFFSSSLMVSCGVRKGELPEFSHQVIELPDGFAVLYPGREKIFFISHSGDVRSISVPAKSVIGSTHDGFIILSGENNIIIIDKNLKIHKLPVKHSFNDYLYNGKRFAFFFNKSKGGTGVSGTTIMLVDTSFNSNDSVMPGGYVDKISFIDDNNFFVITEEGKLALFSFSSSSGWKMYEVKMNVAGEDIYIRDAEFLKTSYGFLFVFTAKDSNGVFISQISSELEPEGTLILADENPKQLKRFGDKIYVFVKNGVYSVGEEGTEHISIPLDELYLFDLSDVIAGVSGRKFIIISSDGIRYEDMFYGFLPVSKVLKFGGFIALVSGNSIIFVDYTRFVKTSFDNLPCSPSSISSTISHLIFACPETEKLIIGFIDLSLSYREFEIKKRANDFFTSFSSDSITVLWDSPLLAITNITSSGKEFTRDAVASENILNEKFVE